MPKDLLRGLTLRTLYRDKLSMFPAVDVTVVMC